MNGFSFSTTAGTSQSTAKPRLAGNNIYEVKFDGCEIQDIQGVKDTSQLYKVLKLKFSNEEGTFEHTVFEPRAEDFDRRETDFTDKTGKVNKIPQPSNVESMMLLFKHAMDSINPAIAKDVDEKKKSLSSGSWDDLRKLLVQILDAGKGKVTKIKLLKNGKTGEAVFPGFFAGLTKEGIAYVKNNFIGDKITFSTYELTRISNEANAKPTKIDSGNLLVPEAESQAGVDINFTVEGL